MARVEDVRVVVGFGCVSGRVDRICWWFGCGVRRIGVRVEGDVILVIKIKSFVLDRFVR